MSQTWKELVQSNFIVSYVLDRTEETALMLTQYCQLGDEEEISICILRPSVELNRYVMHESYSAKNIKHFILQFLQGEALQVLKIEDIRDPYEGGIEVRKA